MLRFARHSVIGANLLKHFSTSEERTNELDKERELRENVLKKYPGLNSVKVPPMSEFIYGNFSTQAPINDNFSGNNSQYSSKARSLLLILLGFTTIWMIVQLPKQKSKENLFIPNWAAPLKYQAQHHLFTFQFDESTRKTLIDCFVVAKEQQPFSDFFSFVGSQRPDFGTGYRYSRDTAISVLSNFLRTSEGISPAIVSRVLQKNEDSRQRVDDLVDAILLSSKLNNSFQLPVSTSSFPSASNTVDLSLNSEIPPKNENPSSSQDNSSTVVFKQ